ncbi:MAG: hypothetical protein H7233_07700, partial [Pseudorhodobacter sp.]|nr:hypothetical protein [Frankiaceae bacterium]
MRLALTAAGAAALLLTACSAPTPRATGATGTTAPTTSRAAVPSSGVPSSSATGGPGPAPAWSAGARLPLAVSEVGVAALGTDVHVLGGYVDGHPGSRTHLVLDTTTGRWHQSAPLPAALDHVGAAVLGDRLYAVGGYGSVTGGTSSVWSWGAASDTRTPRAPPPDRPAPGGLGAPG